MDLQVSSPRKLRVCAVSYLNTLPLVWGMMYGAQKDSFDLAFRLPAECADNLASGGADIGIVPSIELPRQKLELIPGTGIASPGAVRSILLISKVPLPQIRILATDSSSRTSVVLSRIILSRQYGVMPHLVSLPPDLPSMLMSADAALIIGDPAMRLDIDNSPYRIWDLGEEWLKMTGLPMVFAVWAGRKERITPEVVAAFTDSCRYGLAHIEEIVAREALPRGFSEQLAREYFGRNVINVLGDREYEGMRLFLQYASELDSVDSPGNTSA